MLFAAATLPACEPGGDTCAFEPVCGPAGERFGVGSDPTRALLRDLDGDGRLDLVAVSAGPGTLAVGWGWRGEFHTWSIGQEPVDLATGDVDGDGRLDVAAALAGSGEVTLLRGAGPTSLRPAGRVDAGERPVALTAADLDGDGRAELVVAEGDALRVLRWDGARLVPGPAVAAGRGAVALASGDLDGDGLDDVAASLQVDGVVQLFHGSGGSLRPGATLYAGAGPGRLQVADLDGDGARDVAVVDGLVDLAAVAFGDGAGGVRELRTWEVPAEPGDMVVRQGPNGQELVIQSGWQAAVTTIDPTGAGGQRTLPAYTPTLAAGDLDGDGATELVLDGGRQVLGDAPGVVFSPWLRAEGSLSGPVATGDVLGDAAREVVVVDRLFGELAVFEVRTDGLVGPVRSPGSMYADGLTLADVDGDGLAEAILWERAWFDYSGGGGIVPGRVQVARGLGGGRFEPWAELVAEGDVQRMVAWDVEGDGRAELVMFHGEVQGGAPYGGGYTFSSSKALVFDLDDAGLRLREAVEGPLLGGVVDDVDGDGQDELLIAYQAPVTPMPGFEPTAQLMLLEGVDGAIAARPVGELPAAIYYFSGLALGDLTGDGARDVVLCDTSGTVLSEGRGDGTFAEAVRLGEGRRCLDLLVGDGDGDGSPELLSLVDTGTAPAVVVDRWHALPWLRQLVSAGMTTAGNRPSALALADLDGDGALDVAASGHDGLQLLRGGPGVVLQPRAGEELGAGEVVATRLGDVDGDGRDDVLVLGSGGDVGRAMADRSGPWGPVRHDRLWPEDGGSVRLHSAAVGDFDGDGRLEVLANLSRGEVGTSERSYQTRLWAGGAAQVLESGDHFNSVSGMAVGDVDGDGDADVVGTMGSLQVLAVRLGGPEGLGEWQLAVVGVRETSVELGDVDGDGRLDALVFGYQSDVQVFPGDGGGGFASAPRVWPLARKNVRALIVDDVDDDGHPDLLVHEDSGVLFLCRGLGDGRGGRCRHLRALPDGHQVLAAATDDVDGDGASDLLVVTEHDDGRSLVFGRGEGGRFAVHTKPLPGGGAFVTGSLQRARWDDDGPQWAYVDHLGVTPLGVRAR